MRRIFDLLFPPRADETVLRNVSDDDFLFLAAPQIIPVTRPGTIALLPFAKASVRAAIHEAKYHGAERAFGLLATVLADYLRDDDEKFRSAVIAPVPLGEERRGQRGWNQTEEVVRRALHKIGVPGEECFVFTPDLLKRTRETASQVSLPRHAREENMRGAFGATHPANPAHTYILIDDVLTTGATLQAAIDALTAAGARHIIPLALAH